jgi:hypothetical protein
LTRAVGVLTHSAWVVFTPLSLDEDTERITGEFNPHLRAYWLELAGAFTAIEVESLLQLR